MSNIEAVGIVVVGLGILVSLIFTVTKPIFSLTTQLTKLNLNIETLNKKQEEQDKNLLIHKAENSDNHKRIHDKIDYNSDRLGNIEGRLDITPPPPAFKSKSND